jgi:hypothetical protein
MAARGLKIWAFAEFDHARLAVRRLFGARPRAAAPEPPKASERPADA